MKLNFSSFLLGAPAILPALILGAASATFAQLGIDSVATRPGETILFNRDCANEEYYQVRAYAILESGNGAARALMQVSTGYFRARNPAVQIGFEPLELDFDLGPEWADSELSMQVVASTSEREFSTFEFASYFDSDFGGREPIRRSFATDAAGRLQWRDFVEPDLRQSESDEGFNIIDYPYFDASELAIGDASEAIRFSLRLNRDDSDAEILLTGPAFLIPDRIWEMDLPEPRALGLLESFNPFQEGGVIDWLGRGIRYRNCIDDRMEARLLFHN